MDSDLDSDATTCPGSDSEGDDGFTVSDFHGFEDWTSSTTAVAKSCMEKTDKGDLTSSSVCIACWAAKEVTGSHPLFVGGLCGRCKVRLLVTMFATNKEDVHVHCAICGSFSQSAAICCENQCAKNYCATCLAVWCTDWEQLVEDPSWTCFLCRTSTSATKKDGSDGSQRLVPHPDWPNRILAFHEPCTSLSSKALNWKRQPLRVLSLFDGIGTGMFVLRHLGIDVEVYFAAEVLSAATTVSRTRLGPPLRHVCSVGEISRKRLEAMVPIHLLIGGSPCNDFSAVNRFPKDFYDPKGSARFFYDFFRVLRNLQEINGDQHVLWLYENVASMPQTYRKRISKHFQCEPAVIDAKDFSPQLRKRLFWGNVPGLYTAPDAGHGDGRPVEMTLAMALLPDSGRQPAVDKVRTLTTNTNSLLQGRRENCRDRHQLQSLFPVQWQENSRDADDATECGNAASAGKRRKRPADDLTDDDDEAVDAENEVDVLWLPEIEEVFGFPRHYTDVGNLSRSDRQKLLGHTWSVPIITFIFSRLRDYTVAAHV